MFYIAILDIFVAKIMRGSKGGGGQGDLPPPLKNHKNIGFLSNTGPDPLKNKKKKQKKTTTKPVFHVGPSSACQRYAI